MTVSDNLRNLRAELKLSQEKMAQEVGMSKNGYQKLEQQGNNINFKHILHIAKTLNVDIDRLTKGKDSVNIMVGDNNRNYQNNRNFQNEYGTQEIEKFQLIINHKDELLAQKDEIIDQKNKEIILLRQLLEMIDLPQKPFIDKTS